MKEELLWVLEEKLKRNEEHLRKLKAVKLECTNARRIENKQHEISCLKELLLLIKQDRPGDYFFSHWQRIQYVFIMMRLKKSIQYRIQQLIKRL